VYNEITYRDSASSVCHFGDFDLAVDVDGAAGLEAVLLGALAVDVQLDPVPEHAEVDLVPLLVKYLQIRRRANSPLELHVRLPRADYFLFGVMFQPTIDTAIKI